MSRKRAARLLRDSGLRPKGKRRFVRITDSVHALPVFPNLLAHQFEMQRPIQVWSSDLTFRPSRAWEGRLYLVFTLDLHSREIGGYGVDTQMLAKLPLAARRRRPFPLLVHQSDRGSQYASGVFQAELARMRARGSMSREGDWQDNAVGERFFNSLKRALMDKNIFETRGAARQAVLEFIEVFYNRQRPHSTLGYVTPHEFERQATTA